MLVCLFHLLTGSIWLYLRTPEWFTNVGVFLCISSADGKHLALPADVVSGFKSFSEAPRHAQKCGIHRSDSPVRAL
jgi:hypothetical protein